MTGKNFLAHHSLGERKSVTFLELYGCLPRLIKTEKCTHQEKINGLLYQRAIFEDVLIALWLLSSVEVDRTRLPEHANRFLQVLVVAFLEL